jgi:hypothetical protein
LPRLALGIAHGLDETRAITAGLDRSGLGDSKAENAAHACIFFGKSTCRRLSRPRRDPEARKPTIPNVSKFRAILPGIVDADMHVCFAPKPNPTRTYGKSEDGVCQVQDMLEIAGLFLWREKCTTASLTKTTAASGQQRLQRAQHNPFFGKASVLSNTMRLLFETDSD